MYALFPPTQPDLPAKEEMVRQTVQRLKQLDRERPEVILMPEPENFHDPKAIRVYCKGFPMGYVAHEQTGEAHLLFDAQTPMVPAAIVGVEVESKGSVYIEAELNEAAIKRQFAKPEAVDAWKDWHCSIPKLPMPEVWKNCQVLEYQIEKQFPVTTLEQVKNLKNYLKLWIDRSLHDFSVEAMQLRKRYIGQLRTLGLEQNAQRLASLLKAEGYEVASYTGYTFEQLLGGTKAQKTLLEHLDVLIDGPFILAERSLETPFRGSKNQRVLDVPKSLAAGEAVWVTSPRWLGEY